MNNVKKIAAAMFLAIALCVLLITLNRTSTVYSISTEDSIKSEQHDEELRRLARIPSLDEDFKDDEVSIILSYEYSVGVDNNDCSTPSISSQLSKVDNIDINSIEEFFSLEYGEVPKPTYRKIISVKLKTPGKDRVIEAIKRLRELDMVVVAEAQYNYGVAYDV